MNLQAIVRQAMLAWLPKSLAMDRPNKKTEPVTLLMGQGQNTPVLWPPYFVSEPIIQNGIEAAAERCVTVKTRLPIPPGYETALYANFYRNFHKAPAELHECKGDLLHAKASTEDRAMHLLAAIKTDFQSFNLNAENDIPLCDDGFTSDICHRQPCKRYRYLVSRAF